MSSLGQKGVAHLLLLIVLLSGIVTATYLVQNRTNIVPRAEEGDDEPDEPEPESETVRREKEDNPEPEPEKRSEPEPESETVRREKEDAERRQEEENRPSEPEPESETVRREQEEAEARRQAEGAANQGGSEQSEDHLGDEAKKKYDEMEEIGRRFDAATDEEEKNRLAAEYEAKNLEYREAASAFENKNEESSEKTKTVKEIANKVSDNEISWEKAISGNEDKLGVDGIAAVIGSQKDISAKEAKEAAIKYAVDRGYDSNVSSGMAAIAVQTAGGTADEIMEAAFAGAFGRNAQSVPAMSNVIATANYLGLKGDQLINSVINVAKTNKMTAEQAGAGSAALQMTSEEFRKAWENNQGADPAAAAAARLKAKEDEVAGALGSLTPPGGGDRGSAQDPKTPFSPEGFLEIKAKDPIKGGNAEFGTLSKPFNIEDPTTKQTVATFTVTTGTGTGNQGEGQTLLNIPGQTSEPINIGPPKVYTSAAELQKALDAYNIANNTDYKLPQAAPVNSGRIGPTSVQAPVSDEAYRAAERAKCTETQEKRKCENGKYVKRADSINVKTGECTKNKIVDANAGPCSK